MTRNIIAIALTALGLAASVVPATAGMMNEMPDAIVSSQAATKVDRRADQVYNAVELERRDLNGAEIVSVTLLSTGPMMDRTFGDNR